MNFGIATKDVNDAKSEFVTIFSADHLWFFDLFSLIREIDINDNIRFTDVLIKQNRPIMVGIVKNFFSLHFIAREKYKDQIKPIYISGLTEMKIKDFVEKYCLYKQNQLSLKQYNKIPTHINFSLNIYGLGCFRCNFSNSDDGVSLNVRILDFMIPKIDELLSDTNPIDKRIKMFYSSLIENKTISVFNKPIDLSKIKRGGLIIHAGPTGSGKSTFIAGELGYFSDNINGLIITYEDPIEYRFTDYPKVLQIELETHLPNTSEEIYKHFLRNSPSVGSLGEIRTREEFLRVIDLASRGHLVFTTVHANNVKEVFSSFAFFEKDVKQLFATVLLGIICHRLEIDNNGRIYPILETFLNDIVFLPDASRSNAKPIFTLYVDGDIGRLENLLYVQKGYNYFYSFEQYASYIRR